MTGTASAVRTAQTPPGWRGLVGLVRLAPGHAAAKSVCTVVTLGVSLLIPVLAARVVDQVLTRQSAGRELATLATLVLLRALAESYGEVAGVSARTGALAALRHRLVSHILALGVPGTRRHATGDLVTRLTDNASMSARAVPEVVEAVVATAASLGALIALWIVDWRLGVAFLVGALPIVLLLHHLMNRVTSSFGDYLRHLAAIAVRLTDALAGSRTIRAAGTGPREVERILAPMPDLSSAGLHTWAARRAVSWQVAFALVGVRVVVLGVAGLGVTIGRLSPGEFLATALYVSIALGFVQQVDTLMFLAGARAHAGRVLEVLAERPQFRCATRAPADVLPPGPGALSFRRVTVRHEDRTVLDGLCLEVPAGASVAVVGRSGAGKTTLSLLAGRLLDPDEGEVLIDGVRVDSLSPAALRRAVGYAFDHPVLLGGTVRDALTYGCPDTTRADVGQAASVAQAEAFVQRLPQGLDTPLTGAPLSGGELQRLGLARAVVHGGRILVLDDATSSLDTITEAKLAAALTEGLAGRTRFLVAHRVATAARADLVAWLEDGRIRAVAPHHVLWAAEPAYRAVFAAMAQVGEEKPQAEEEELCA
jgi:ATP-binding cassette, subfamily B, bacterial